MKEFTLTISKNGFLQGVKDCIPTLLGYWSIGFAAGVVEKTSGLSISEIVLMSLLLYAGSAQFIAAGMIAAQNPISAIIFTIFFVNLRHLLLSAALAPHLKHLSSWKNIAVGSLLTDETFGVAVNRIHQKKRIQFAWMLGLNITAYLNWLLANIIGGMFGQMIPNPESLGLDYALSAMFIGLLVLQMEERSTNKHKMIVAISTAVFVIGISFLFSGYVSVILATLLGATLGVMIERWK